LAVLHNLIHCVVAGTCPQRGLSAILVWSVHDTGVCDAEEWGINVWTSTQYSLQKCAQYLQLTEYKGFWRWCTRITESPGLWTLSIVRNCI
jgi:hypothetical protein